MIALFVALIFYIVDPLLGIILALVLPSVVGMDTTGEYGNTLLAVVFAVVVYFVRKVSFDQEEG